MALVVAAWVPLLSSAQALQPQLEVSLPNGYVVETVDDLQVPSPMGPIRWTRQWNGVEWRFNPQWESLSQSWKNLTGSSSADTTGSVGSGPVMGSSSGGGSAQGCWVWVDEDWQPSNETTMVGGSAQPVIENGVVKAAPMVAARTTPFNRLMGEGSAEAGDYPRGQRISIDYASLCAGGSISYSGIQDLEGIRRANELYLGDGTRYAFNNRSVLEKRTIQELPAENANSRTRTAAKAGVKSFATSKGYRWIDKTGDWTDYNIRGQVAAFGDGNNNILWLQRDISGRVTGVKDSQGSLLLSLYYTGELLTEVRDHSAADIVGDLPARSIRYEYDNRNRLTQVVDARGNAIQYGYDIANRITSVTDQQGRATTLAYNGETIKQRIAPDGGVTDYEFDYDDVHKQFISKVTGPEAAAGRRVEDYTHNRVGKLVRKYTNGRLDEEVSYDSGSRAESHTNTRGFTTRIVRDEFERVVQIDHPDGSTQKSSYSAVHLGLTEETDELGVKTRYEYDAKGNLVRRLQAVGMPEERVTEYEVDSRGLAVGMTRKGRTEANGSITPDASWRLEYDARGNLQRTTDPEGHIRSYVFSRIGDMLRYTDPKGNIWRYTYDADGNPLGETDPLGRTTAYVYDKAGNLVSATDERGKTYQFAYDSLNRQTLRTDPAGGQYRSSYNLQGTPASVTDASGKAMRFDYDALMRLTQAVDSKDQSYQLSYSDADGSENNAQRPTRMRYPTFDRHLRYDNRDRLTLRNDQAGSETRVESYSYDGAGRQKTATDANGKTRTYTYNPYGEVTEAKDPLGNTLRLVRDTRGNVIEVVDPNGQSTRMAYDRRNLLIASTDPLGHTARYTHDANGWLATIEQANGQKVAYGYDVLGRVISQREHDAQGTLRKTTSYQYDAAGNLTSWSDGSYSASRSYDDADRLQSETVRYGAFGLSHAYTYHANGQIKTYTGPDGVAIEYEYDGTAQLERLTIPGAGTLSVADWQWAQPKKVILPGGAEQRLEYDGYQNLTRLRVVNPAQATVFDLQNQYGKLADITQASFDGTVLQYQHDDAGRLLSVIAPQASARSESFGLDANSNRTRHSRTGPDAWNYDAAGQLTSRPSAGGAGTVSYRYDASGNLTEKIDSSKPEPARTTRYSWDAFNRLQEIRDGAGALIARYAYDPFDRRLTKELGDSATLAKAGETGGNSGADLRGQSTHYLASEWGLLAEADASGNVQIAYGWNPQRESSTAPLFARLPQSGAWRTVYYHNDHQGTPQRITDGLGQLLWSADYDAYGKAQTRTTADTAMALVSNLRYPGQYWDAESGLHYNDRRYYDPDTGRYASADPLGFEGGINLYTYAAAAPGRYTDPTGEIIPCLAANYLRCMTVCSLQGVAMQAVGNALSGCGDIDLLQVAKDCAVDCLWSMLPIPDPCGRFGKLLSGAVGLMGNSFTGDTVVHARDANGNPILKPIRDIRQGDEVLAWDETALVDGQLSQAKAIANPQVQAKTAASARPASASRYEKVSGIMTSELRQKLVHITLESGQTLTATQGHPFRTDEGWRDAVLLKKGGKLLLKGSGDEETDSAPNPRTATIADVRIETKTVRVFNLEVENLHTFFVGEGGVVVHNTHGNSASSTAPQHGYEIFEKSTGDRAKTGISGGCIGKNGKSKRAQKQVNALNKAAGYDKYDSQVVVQSVPGSIRQDMLNWEVSNANQLRAAGHSMTAHIRP